MKGKRKEKERKKKKKGKVVFGKKGKKYFAKGCVD